jgi:hypothetical protein
MDEREIARIEDLALRLADGILTVNEADELEHFLERDPAAVQSQQGILELEACLRSGRENLDLVHQTMARLRAALEEEITRGSMERILSGPPPAWNTQSSTPKEGRAPPRAALPRARLRIAAVALLTLAAAGALVMVLDRSRQGPTLGSIVTSTPGVILVGGGNRATTAAKSGDLLTTGDSVRVPPGGSARIRYGEGVDLELGPETSLILGAPSREAGHHGEDRARLIVANGTVTAGARREHTSGALVFVTPHAEASATSGEIVVSVLPKTTVFEVREGHARIRRSADGAALDLTPGSFALASPSAPLVARPIAEGRRRHPDAVPPDHTLPPVTPHGHDQDFHPELKQHGEEKTP